MLYTDGYGNLIVKDVYMEVTEKLLSNKNELMKEFNRINTKNATRNNNATFTATGQDGFGNVGELKENLYFFFDLKKYYNSFKAINEFIDDIANKINPSLKPNFYVTYEGEPSFNEVETELLRKINNKLADTFNTGLKFPVEKNFRFGEEYISIYRSWNFDKVYETNNTLNSIIDKVQSANLSPYERYLAVYNWVSGFVYSAEGVNEHSTTSRRVVEVLTGNKIVCTGFVSLLTTLCEKLDIPAKEFIVLGDNGLHSRALIKMVDPKYGLNGIYQADPTFDSGSSNANKNGTRSFFHHLLPLKFNDGREITAGDSAKPLFDFINLEGEELNKSIDFGIHKNGTEAYFELSKKNMLGTSLISYEEVGAYFENKVKHTNNNKTYSEDTKKTMLKEISEDKERTLNKAIDRNKIYIRSFHNKVNQSEPVSIVNFANALAISYAKVKVLDNPKYTMKDGIKFANEVANYNLKVGRSKVYNDNKMHLINQTTFTNLDEYNKLIAEQKNSASKNN